MWITVFVFLLLSLELLLLVVEECRGDGSCCSCVRLVMMELSLMESFSNRVLCLGDTFHVFGSIMFPRLLLLIVAVASPLVFIVMILFSGEVKNILAIVIRCDDKNDNENDTINNNSSSKPIVYNTNTDLRLVLKYRCKYI